MEKNSVTYEKVVKYIMNTEGLSREEATIRADMMPMSEMQALLKELENSTPRQYMSKREIKKMLYEFACRLADLGYPAELALSEKGTPHIQIGAKVPILIIFFASTRTYRIYTGQAPYATVESQDEAVAVVRELLA